MTESTSLSIAAVGDIQLHGSYQDAAREGEAAELFAPLKTLTAGADIGVGNMETVLTLGGKPREDKLCLRTHPVYAEVLCDAGLNLLTVANNHLLDYHTEGLEDTLGYLERAGIDAVGGGVDAASALVPAIREHQGIRIGFLAACHASTKADLAGADGRPGAAPLNEQALWPAIDALKPQVDHVVLLLHWGLEYSHIPTPEQVAFAHAAIDRGVSLILGHHSHALQGIEHYGNGIVAYSMANLTDAPVDWQGPTRHYSCEVEEVDRESMLLRLSATKTRIRLDEIVPLWLDDLGRPTPATGARAKKILCAIDEHSRKLQDTDLERYWQDTVIESRVTGPLAAWWNEGSLLDKIRSFRPGQIVSAWVLLTTWLKLRFSQSESRWMLFNSRNDERPMPSADRGDSPKRT
jgi:poly-gamma-glutamate synthesis protein (capsule biosynthesis protein)